MSYEVVPAIKLNQPHEAEFARHCRLDIIVSRTLTVIWGLGNRALEAQLIEYAKEFIRMRLKGDSLRDVDFIELSTTNAPNKPLFEINLEGYIHNPFDEDLLLVSEDGANLLARTYPIAFSISEKAWVNNHAHVLRFE